jgi:hypothetical protein
MAGSTKKALDDTRKWWAEYVYMFVLFCFKSYPIGGLKAYAGQKKNPNPVLVD